MFPIRLRIWHKLFFSILLVILLILAVNMFVTRFSFQQGFAQYNEEIRQKKLDSFGQTLSKMYQQNGSWDFLKDDYRYWHQLLANAELAPPPPPERPRPPEHSRRGSPPGFGPPGPRFEEGHPPPPPSFMRGLIGLLDKTQTPIFGPPDTANTRKLSLTLENEVIGYLSMQSFKPMRTEMARRFASQQFNSLLLTALLSFVIAVIASMLLARAFNQPIARLGEMARQLTSGKFESRIQQNSRDELGDLAVDLNILAETLDQNQQSRRQWISDISHELRTPLTILRGELEAMEDGVRPLNSDSVQSLSVEIKHLQRLVDDLYQLSLSDQGSLTYEKQQVDPFELLRSVAEGFELPMQQHQISLSVSCEENNPTVLADPQRLTQLYTNLLENSLRYTDAGGTVNIRCKNSSPLIICFEDSAPGVSVELIPRLFERLFRVDDSRSRNSGGTGLGLSIAQAIANAHGGKLTAEASSLGGLKVCLELPVETGR